MAITDDFVAQNEKAQTLSGLSGAHVLLVTKDDRHWFVRKVARDPAASERLQQQMVKQLAFSAAVGEVVRTPRVLEHGEIDGRFYFDMEFIRGTDGVNYLRRASYADVVSFSDRLCVYIKTVASLSSGSKSPDSLFQALYRKLCEVQRKTQSIGSETLARLFVSLERVRNLDDALSTTLCHGDLTLENIVVDNERQIWMLDLLDAPFEHYWQDVAKLHQDLEGGWYLLSQPQVSRCVLEYISRRLTTTVLALDPRYAELHAILLACTFVRILPYVRTPNEEQFVKHRIEHFARLAHTFGEPQ